MTDDIQPVPTDIHKINKWPVMAQRQGFIGWQSVLVFVAGLVLIAGPRLANLGEFVVFDESLYWPWANQFFKALLNGDWAATLVGRGHPAITVLIIQCLGLGVRYVWALLSGESVAQALDQLHLDNEIIVFSDLAVRRLPMALINIAVVVVLLVLIYRQFGRQVALVSTILLALDPFLLSDSRTLRADALMSVLMTISAISLVIFLIERNWRYLLLSGLVAGLAFANKTSALAITPFVGLSLSAFVCWQVRQSGWLRAFRLGLLSLLTWLGLLILVLWSLWPALWVVPGAALDLMLGFAVNTSIEGRTNFYMGQVYTNQPLPLFYIIIILLRISPLALIGLMVGLVKLFSRQSLAALKSQLLNPSYPITQPDSSARMLLTTVTLIGYVVTVWLVVTIGVLKRDHYVMPVFPALDILGAIGLVGLLTGLTRRPSIRRPQWQPEKVWGLGAGLVLIIQAGLSLPNHPYYYQYYNPLILGPLWAHRVTMIDWGPDLGEAARYLNALEKPESLKAASATVARFIPEFKGTTIRFVYGAPWIQADYIIIPYEDFQFPTKINPPYYAYALRRPVVHEMILNSVPFGWIYKGPAAQYYAGSKLDGLGLLLGYNFDKAPLPAGSTVPLKLFWQNDGRSADDLLWVRLTSAAGYVWAENLAQPLPDFTQAALTDEAVVESQVNLAVPVGVPPGVYFLKMGFQSAGTGELLGTFKLPGDGDKLSVTRPVGPVSPAGLPIDHSLDQALTPQITLLGYSLADNLLTQSDPNPLTLFWQAKTTVGQDYVMNLQLLDRRGQEAAYWLGRPVMGGYPTQAWLAEEIVRDPWQLKLPPQLSPGDYTLQLTLFDAVTQAKVKLITLGDVTVAERRRQFDVPPMQQTVNANLADEITLLGYDLLSKPITGGGRLRVTLYWQARQTIPVDYTVFTQLLGPDGVVVGQHDSAPAEGRLPTTTWQVGEVISDRHQFDYATAQKGEYRLIVGIYNPVTGARLPIVASADAPVGDFLLLNTFTIEK